MSAKIPAFGLIGAQAKAVLTGSDSGVYQYNKKLTFATKTADGVAFTSTIVQSGNNAADATLKAAVKDVKTGIPGQTAWSGTFQQTGKILGTLTQSNITPGLSLTLTGTYPDANSGKLGVDYILPHVTLKSSIGLTASPVVDAAVTTGYPDKFVGVETSFNSKTNEFTKWTIGAGFLAKDFQLGFHLLERGEVVKATFAQRVNDVTIVAGEVNHNIKKGDSTSIILGGETKLDNGALVKARIDSDSIVSLHWEGVVHPKTSAGVSLQLNASNFDSPPRLGFAASTVA